MKCQFSGENIDNDYVVISIIGSIDHIAKRINDDVSSMVINTINDADEYGFSFVGFVKGVMIGYLEFSDDDKHMYVMRWNKKKILAKHIDAVIYDIYRHYRDRMMKIIEKIDWGDVGGRDDVDDAIKFLSALVMAEPDHIDADWLSFTKETIAS